MCITTWKLFETLLSKQHRHVAHNLVLRNLASHAHVSRTSMQCDTASVHDMASATETNCIDCDSVNTHDDEITVSNHVTSASLSAPQTLPCDNSDTLASGDDGLCHPATFTIHFPSSLPSLDAVVRSTEDNNVSTSCDKDGPPSPLARTDVMASMVWDNFDMINSVAGGDTDVRSHTVSKYRSTFASNSLPSHVTSPTLSESNEVSIQSIIHA